MRVLLVKHVKKWFDHEKSITKTDLFDAAQDIVNGRHEASLGGGIYKKRISNMGDKGKSGGSRLIIAYKKDNAMFFMYAFNKNERDNISEKEKRALKERAKLYFKLTDDGLKKAIKSKLFYEIRM